MSLIEHIADRSAWTPRDLEKDDSWKVSLTDRHCNSNIRMQVLVRSIGLMR